MPDLLERRPEATVTSHDVWATHLIAAFGDGTPVTRPAVKSETFEALVGLFNARLQAYSAHPDPVSHPGTEALRQMQEWLNLPLDRIVQVAGLGPSTRAYWRSHPTAPIRRGKTGRLLRLRSAVGLLVGTLGPERARALLHAEGWLGEPMDESRLAALEARVREQFVPGGLRPPAQLVGLSREERRARALRGTQDDLDQQSRERETAAQLGPDDYAPEEP